jgi:glycosyltransferase involved in cell wall biosynthesis
MKIVAVIPTYNEAKFIENVVYKTKKYVDMVVVSDDRSKDNTVDLAEQTGAYVVRNVLDARGTGQNTWRGIQFALLHDADIIVTLDGDGQHNPDEIPQLIKPIIENKADFVVGSRFTNYKSIPLYRRLGISIITFTYNIFKKAKVSDAQSGFRAHRKEVFEKCPITELGFGFSMETLVKFRENKFRFAEVPIVCIYHGDLKLNSSMNPIKHGIKVWFKTIMWRIKVEILWLVI